MLKCQLTPEAVTREVREPATCPGLRGCLVYLAIRLTR